MYLVSEMSPEMVLLAVAHGGTATVVGGRGWWSSEREREIFQGRDREGEGWMKRKAIPFYV